MNGNERNEYWADCIAKGTLPDHSRGLTDFWEFALPGRNAFRFAHQVLASNVEEVVADFTTMDIRSLGVFDVVMFLGRSVPHEGPARMYGESQVGHINSRGNRH